MKGSAGAAGGILLRQKESRRRGGREEEADEFGEVSIHLHDVREIEKQSRQSDAGFSESGGYGTEKIPAPPADECIKALRWDEGPAFGIDADTGLAVARTEPPLEALDENGVLHLAVKSHWMNLQEIDSLTQSFKAQIWLQFSWFVRLPPHKLGSEDKIWRPEMTLSSCSEKRHVGRMRVIDRQGGSLIFYTYSINDTFSLQFDLKMFPFDSQKIRISAVFWQSPFDAVTLYDDDLQQPIASRPFRGRLQFHEDLSMLYTEEFIDKDSWRVVRDVHVWTGVTDEQRRAKQDGVRFSKLHVGLSIQRRHEYYVMNAVTPFFLFVTFSFLSFGPTDGDQGLGGAGLTDKTQITLSMVLTAAAFKIALASFTPKVSYMTALDQYQLTCFCFLGVVAVQNICSSGLTGRPHSPLRKKFNFISSVIISGLWFVLHVAFVMLLVWRRLQRHRSKLLGRHPPEVEEDMRSEAVVKNPLREERTVDPKKVPKLVASKSVHLTRSPSLDAHYEYGQPMVVGKLSPVLQRQSSFAGPLGRTLSIQSAQSGGRYPSDESPSGGSRPPLSPTGGSGLLGVPTLTRRPAGSSTGSLQQLNPSFRGAPAAAGAALLPERGPASVAATAPTAAAAAAVAAELLLETSPLSRQEEPGQPRAAGFSRASLRPTGATANGSRSVIGAGGATSSPSGYPA